MSIYLLPFEAPLSDICVVKVLMLSVMLHQYLINISPRSKHSSLSYHQPTESQQGKSIQNSCSKVDGWGKGRLKLRDSWGIEEASIDFLLSGKRDSEQEWIGSRPLLRIGALQAGLWLGYCAFELDSGRRQRICGRQSVQFLFWQGLRWKMDDFLFSLWELERWILLLDFWFIGCVTFA